MKLVIKLVCGLPLLLGACSAPEEPVAKELSQMDINSAKRQCVNVAVMQQTPNDAANDAAKDICDCTIDDLTAAGQFTSTQQPTDEQQQKALDKCIDAYAQKK